jgi:hypothetical protein
MAHVDLNLELIESLGNNSPIVRDWMTEIGYEIYQEIYETAPRTIKHGYSYRDHFRIWTTRNDLKEGYRVYVIAERFQWQFIEFGWTEWRDNIRHKGLYIMTKALMKQRIG